MNKSILGLVHTDSFLQIKMGQLLYKFYQITMYVLGSRSQLKKSTQPVSCL